MATQKFQLDSKKISIFFALALILVNILFSYQFITENAHHTCSEEHCPICVQLEEALQFIQSIKCIPTTPFLMTVLFLLIRWVPFAVQQLCPSRTLISLKVELLD